MPVLGVVTCLLIFASGMMVCGLPMMMRRCFVMTSRLVMTSPPCFAALVPYLLIKFATM
ncbi:MAG: hypothetical protein JOY69_04290 [Candidatus Eremiobacteraeota bacterium]|nr:hypothetical protein [Candidatus Eremiobacteraeota bacterium]